SRRRHTRSKRDWSSDVCSSDLSLEATTAYGSFLTAVVPYIAVFGSIFTFVYSTYLFVGVFVKQKDKKVPYKKDTKEAPLGMLLRSEERRVGKECMTQLLT